MALTEYTEIGQITFLADGQIQVRTDTVIERNGIEISRTYHRHVVEPGNDLDVENPRVKALAQVDHTPARIALYKVAKAARAAVS